VYVPGETTSVTGVTSGLGFPLMMIFRPFVVDEISILPGCAGICGDATAVLKKAKKRRRLRVADLV
jgi:hypothetical protein